VDYETIAYDVSDQLATITLDRPDRLNGFTIEMCHELVDAFDRADTDDDVRAVVVTGRGRAFCAGADLAAGSETFDYGGIVERDPGGIVALRIFASRKPVIGAINGPAVGVGASMTLPMDVRLIAEGARMGFVFGARGIVPDAASSWFLPRIVGPSLALEWCLTARIFPADVAVAAGLARSVHPPGELLPAARALATEMATAVGPVSAAITRQLLWRMLTVDHPMEAHRVDSLAIARTGALADAAEGVTAFLEKRPARWTLSVDRDLPDWYPWWGEPAYDREG